MKFTPHAEIHGESYKAYRMKISFLEQEILLNVLTRQTWLIFADPVT